MCGEKASSCVRKYPISGSPPRVRGKVCLVEKPRQEVGITPACAGKSTADNVLFQALSDHPRVCGEKSTPPTIVTPPRGSPPRVRGKGNLLKVLVPLGRITPACAGKRKRACCAFDILQDHPRVCGEKRAFAQAVAARHGSPPRVRGKVRLERRSVVYARITPACAGKRPLPTTPTRNTRDHPRVCGEKR